MISFDLNLSPYCHLACQLLSIMESTIPNILFTVGYSIYLCLYICLYKILDNIYCAQVTVCFQMLVTFYRCMICLNEMRRLTPVHSLRIFGSVKFTGLKT